MQDLTTRIQMIEAEMSALRSALRRLQEAFAEADRIPDPAAVPRLAAVIQRVQLGTRPWVQQAGLGEAMSERIEQALYSDNFVFRPDFPPEPPPALRPELQSELRPAPGAAQSARNG